MKALAAGLAVIAMTTLAPPRSAVAESSPIAVAAKVVALDGDLLLEFEIDSLPDDVIRLPAELLPGGAVRQDQESCAGLART